MDPQQPTETPAPVEQPTTETATPTASAAPAADKSSVAPAADGSPKKGYGKRPIWQWVLLYVVVAVIVYGLVYYFFLRSKGTTSTY